MNEDNNLVDKERKGVQRVRGSKEEGMENENERMQK